MFWAEHYSLQPKTKKNIKFKKKIRLCTFNYFNLKKLMKIIYFNILFPRLFSIYYSRNKVVHVL